MFSRCENQMETFTMKSSDIQILFKNNLKYSFRRMKKCFDQVN